MDLIVIRHARPERQEVTEGAADPPLTPLGQQMAQATAEFLAPESVDHIVASTMVRARETAAPLVDALSLPLETRHDLIEVDAHSGEYIPAEEIKDNPEYLAKFQDDPMQIFEGDYDGFRDRVVAGFDEVIAANRGRTVAVYCHGMVITVYLRSILNFSSPFDLLIDYCGISRIQASSTGLRSVRSINETAHVRDLLP